MLFDLFPPSPTKAAAVLSAAAVAVEHGEDIQQTLEHLALNEPSLGPILNDVIDEMALGSSLSYSLRKKKIISRKEHELLQLTEEWGGAKQIFPILAEERLRRPVSMYLHDYFPLWIVGSILFGGIWTSQILSLFSDHPIDQIYAELAIEIPPFSELAFGPLAPALLYSISLFGSVWLFMSLLRMNPDWRLFRVCCGLSVERPRLRRELLFLAQLAHCALLAGVDFPRKMWRPVWRAYLLSMYLGRQLTVAQQTALSHCDAGDLIGRLQIVGVLASGNDPCEKNHWQVMIRASGREQRSAYTRLRSLLFVIVLVLTFGSFVSVVFLPLVRLIQEIA